MRGLKKILKLFLLLFFISIIAKYCCNVKIFNRGRGISEKQAIENLMKNYEDEVLILSKRFDVPASYLLALIMLESSGRKKIPARFEKHIYEKLLKVKHSKLKSFENIKPKDLKIFSDKTLKKMSYSYGPFQIMGYKSLFLNISLSKLTGKKNMYYAVKWIKKTYGKSLKEKNYKDAFHIHNTGRKHPVIGRARTYDPDYVENGLRFEKIFRKKLQKKGIN